MRRLLTLAILGIALGAAAQPVVVATSEVFGSLTRTIGGEEVLVITIIPAGFCPAHYDLRPSDFLHLSQAKLVLYHGFEPWMDRLLANVNPEAMVLKLGGPWNYPEALAGKAKAVAEALSKILPEKAEIFEQNLTSFLSALEALSQEIQNKAQELGLSTVPTIVMAWQESFARWLGLNVVATYPPEERLSVKDLVALAEKGRESGVKLVIDNLQSGASFGGRLAHAIGAVHVVLTNFPGPIPGTVDMLTMLRVNADLVFAAVETMEAVPTP
ncbi:MAG: metal ABC transporter substrate-binding protein [Candidatus Bipolaricaulaceae bacterium]